MATTAEAKSRFTAITVEKGIRQVAPHRWEVRVYAGRDPETGKVRHVTRTTTMGIRAARTLRAKLTTEVASGQHGASGRGTFGELLDAWLRDGKQGRAESTMASYRSHIESAIRPALGPIPLAKLTARDLDRFYAKLTKDGVSPAMIMHHHRVVSAALRQGEKWGMVPGSVARNATPPRVPVKPLTIPPPERVRQLIDAAAASSMPEMAAIITVAALTGMRRGELAGLQWGDIDFEESVINVNRSVWQTGPAWGIKDPKTHQVRRVLLGDHAAGVLLGRFTRASATAGECEVDLGNDAFVFSDKPDGSVPIMPDRLSRRFNALCRGMEEAAEEAGLEEDPWPYRLHDLRHYSATELFRAGHHARTVADRLGHSDPALTLRVYTHTTPDRAQAAADDLESGLIEAPAVPA